MSDFTTKGYERFLDRPYLDPTTIIGFTLSSLLLAFLYTLYLDFDGSYVKAPKHFPYRGRFVKFRKPNVKAPLVELNEHGDYRKALERGSNLASFFFFFFFFGFSVLAVMERIELTRLLLSIPASHTGFLIILTNGSSFPAT